MLGVPTEMLLPGRTVPAGRDCSGLGTAGTKERGCQYVVLVMQPRRDKHIPAFYANSQLSTSTNNRSYMIGLGSFQLEVDLVKIYKYGPLQELCSIITFIHPFF